MVAFVVVLWLWFTRYVGGRPKIGLNMKLLTEYRTPSLLKKSRDRNDQL